MSFEPVSFGIIELVLSMIIGLLCYLWRTQSAEVRRTALDLNELCIKFAELHGTTSATNRTLFSQLSEMKEAIQRIEDHLLKGK